MLLAPTLLGAVSYGDLTLVFEPNRGQVDRGAKFLARGHGYTVFVTATGAILVSRRAPAKLARLTFPGGAAGAPVDGADPLPGRSNYLLGNGPHVTDIPQFGRVRVHDLYPGIDLVYYGKGDALEYDFVVAPGADLRRIRIRWDGPGATRIDRAGDFLSEGGGTVLRQKRPQIYQENGAGRDLVPARYIRTGLREVAIEVGPYDHTRPLVIDPMLVYSTYLGGTGADSANGIAVDTLGNAYIVGTTGSTNFPTGNPKQAGNGGGNDIFVTKIDPTGTQIVYSTYLGGSGSDIAGRIAVDTSGNAYITGSTTSSNFPVQSAYQSSKRALTDGFVAKLSPDGNSLVYSTYFGTDSQDSASGIAVDASGNAYVTGYAGPGLPMVNALQTTYGGGSSDAFVAEFSPTGSLLYSTYLGGSGADAGSAIALDGLNICVAGTTSSANFPTVNPRQAALNGPTDAFVAKLDSSGAFAIFSTYLGGSTTATGQEGIAGIGTDSFGNVYATGTTFSSDFPTQNALQPTMHGLWSPFVTAYNSTGTGYLYSTFLSGAYGSYGYDIAVEPSGAVAVVGSTVSSDFPLMSPIQPALASNAFPGNAFITRLGAAGTLLFSTFLGGSHSANDAVFAADTAQAVALDSAGAIYVAGQTPSSSFPVTSGALRTSDAGGFDAFIAKIDLSALPCSYSFSPASPNMAASGGVLSITVTTTGGCIWTASGSTSSSSWSTLTSPTGLMVGSGTVSVTAPSNPGLFSRSDTITVAGINLAVTQDGQPFPCPASPIAFGQTVNGELAATDCASVSRAGRYADFYTFTATAGQQAAIELVNSTADTYLYLYGPGNQLLAQNDDILQTNCHLISPTQRVCDLEITDSRIPAVGFFTLPATGTYTIEATTYDPADVGTYTLRLLTPDSTDCNFQISPLFRDSPSGGGSGTVNISVGNGCAWYQDSGASWVTATPNGGAGPGTVTYTVDPSPSSSPRSATLIVANQAFVISQDGTACSFSLPASSASVPLSGATQTVNVTATAGCMWSAIGAPNWITFASGGAGSGNGTLTYTVAPSPAGASRVRTLQIGGQPFTVVQGTPAVLGISPTHSGNFMQGQKGVTYTLAVGNAAGAGPTTGVVRATETLPAGLELVSMAGGPTWDCTVLPTCTTSSVLNAGLSYPTIIVTTNVAADAASQLTNQVSVLGGGSAGASASDPTSVAPFSCDANGDQVTDVSDVQVLVDEALGARAALHDLNHDSTVDVADIQKLIGVVVGQACKY